MAAGRNYDIFGAVALYCLIQAKHYQYIFKTGSKPEIGCFLNDLVRQAVY